MTDDNVNEESDGATDNGDNNNAGGQQGQRRDGGQWMLE